MAVTTAMKYVRDYMINVLSYMNVHVDTWDEMDWAGALNDMKQDPQRSYRTNESILFVHCIGTRNNKTP